MDSSASTHVYLLQNRSLPRPSILPAAAHTVVQVGLAKVGIGEACGPKKRFTVRLSNFTANFSVACFSQVRINDT